MTAGQLTRPSSPGEQMSEVVQFIRKRDLERALLIQEARAPQLALARCLFLIWGVTCFELSVGTGQNRPLADPKQASK
jgi:hypothetical protein